MKDFRADYFVAPRAGKWKLILEYRERSYEALGEAIKAAIETAHAAGKSGCASRVLVQTVEGTWEAVWTYGLDSYPPRSRERFFGML
jgi:hypothetical protein